MSRRGFTLVEVLIAAAIVGVLASLLAPALSGARESAHAIVCLTNLRELTSAVTQHAEDRRGAYPPGARDFSRNLDRWHGTRSSSRDPFRAGGGPLSDYLGPQAHSHALRECPTFAPVAHELRAAGTGFETAAGGYGYNNAFVGVVRARRGETWAITTDETGSRAARFRRPAATIAFTDAALQIDRLIEYSFTEPRRWPDFPGYAPDPSMHFRHTGASAVAWLDGHVSLERMTQTEDGWFSDGHSGAAGLGWTGTSNSNELYDYE